MKKNTINKILIILLIGFMLFSNIAVFAENEEATNPGANTRTVEENTPVVTSLENTEESFPKIIVQNVSGKVGDTFEIKVDIQSEQFITSGGFIISYNNKFENIECISGEKYTIENSIDQENGKIAIAFTSKNETETDTQVNLCTIKLKVPSNFNIEENRVIAVQEVDSLYSDRELVSHYYNEDGTIELQKNTGMDTKSTVIMIVVVAVIVAVLLTVVSLVKKKK